ncbi:rhodanese-like domain-containing protein [Micromonospora sp. NBC_01796]|uniref:rhodanese-like domain-containing protein n=1 Tax=Micromonospora sp. NBC_01796 TaxID=2975987 RepID=UPI002DDBD9FC|nr:rhodanese-like domain-containing protein [Micromonospora sp. NBC_01796]WSA84430.1 rhodanese-like domain-containing protein [Micromonospora sp. NBC_01796]
MTNLLPRTKPLPDTDPHHGTDPSPETSNVLRTPPGPPADAVAHFAARLAFETDVSDVHADLEAGVSRLVVVDSRDETAWRQGHLPGAVHLPRAEIARRAPDVIPPGTAVVTYCWGPGCNGATRAALEFARLGYPVKEMLGGYEYWVREGFAVQSATGPVRRPVDDLTAPVLGDACGC